MLASRIIKILPSSITPQQYGFVPGKPILDSIMTVHEVIHSLEEDKREGFLLKLDMSKAYDCVDWAFLLKVLKAFGFNSRVIKLIILLMATTSPVVLVNDSPLTFFKPSRGLKQGDPFSPIIFIPLPSIRQNNEENGGDQILLSKTFGGL